MFTALRAQAMLGTTIRRDLTHALIFYTSGEAVRKIDPAFVPMIDSFDI